jgi:hypothetical protein
MDPDPAIFFSGFQDANKNKNFFLVFWLNAYRRTIYIISLRRLQVIKKSHTVKIKVFLGYWLVVGKSPDPYK